MKASSLPTIALLASCLLSAPLLLGAQSSDTTSPQPNGQSTPATQEQKAATEDKSQTDTPPQQKTPAPLPNAPSSSKTEPSLGDLGFSASETQADARRQALLDKRTHMLKVHQKMGLITAIPLVATVIAGTGAGGKDTSSASRDFHVALGAVTGDLYGITTARLSFTRRWRGFMGRG